MSEKLRLLEIVKAKPLWIRRYQSSHKCIKTKAVILTLVWNFIVSFLYGLLSQPDFLIIDLHIPYYYIYGANAFLLCFYPLAGCLADNKFGRYKTIFRSLECLLIVLAIEIILIVVLFINLEGLTTDMEWYSIVGLAIHALILIIELVCFIMFCANLIQFGIDQLHDSPADHQNLFIYWYVWTSYVAMTLPQYMYQLVLSRSYLLQFGSITCYCIAFFLLFVSLLITTCNQQWFLIDSAKKTPYKLVYKVTQFACQNKVPIYRSAFTYCEDDIPHGIDLGKRKYGGPFTTEQVEDVKAFYGILKVLFVLSLSFILELPCDTVIYRDYILHVSYKNLTSGDDDNWNPSQVLLSSKVHSSLIIVIGIPIVVCIARPCRCFRLSMLKVVGFGILLRVVSTLCTFIMDTVAHAKNNQLGCMFDESQINVSHNSIYPTALLYVQYTLYSLSYMFLYISLYQFICAQSPHSMKGLLIGLSFAVKGLSEFFAAALILPFTYIRRSFPSCGMEYYLVNIFVGVVGLALYACVARKYKLRERDEPCHVRRFVEDYYSKIQQEDGYN